MKYAIIVNGKVENLVLSDAPLDDNWHANPPPDVQIGDDFNDGQYQASPERRIVSIKNVQFTGAELADGIYCKREGTTAIITADMISPSDDLTVPAGHMRVIVEKQVRGQTVEEMPFTATITAADGETPARLSLPIKLSAGFYKITPERLNIGLANPKINAPYRLQFDAIDIDCVGAV